jgi:homoserine kinase
LADAGAPAGRWPEEALSVSAPGTSANLGPGFDTLAVALDIANEVTVTRRPGPLEVRVSGEGAGELEEDGGNLVCRALESGLGPLEDMLVECRNRIPLGRGLGSSAAAVCAGLVAANALGGLRWTPHELLSRATALEGHADNAAACLAGAFTAAGPGPAAVRIEPPDGLCFVTVVPEGRVSTDAARLALPAAVPLADAAVTVAHAVGLALALEAGRLDDLPELLHDRLHEPYRGRLVPGLGALRQLVGRGGCLGATISGSGPSVLLWSLVEDAPAIAERARAALRDERVDAAVRVARISSAGVSARWLGGRGRLAKAVG